MPSPFDNLLPRYDAVVIGAGASELEDTLKAVLAESNRVITPDPTPESGRFYRSDHISLAKKGVPMLYVFSTCRDFIRTVPSLQHDQDRPEDLDTDGEDHVADEARYGCMSRPWVPAKAPEPPRDRLVYEAGPNGVATAQIDLMAYLEAKRKKREQRW